MLHRRSSVFRVEGGQCTTQCATGYTPSTAQLGCSRGLEAGKPCVFFVKNQGSMKFSIFWGDQTLQIYVMLERFPLGGELFWLVIS